MRTRRAVWQKSLCYLSQTIVIMAAGTHLPSHMVLLAAAGLLGMQACSVKGGPPNASSGRHWGCYSLQTNRFVFSVHAFSRFITLMVSRSPGVFACYRKLPACMWVGHCCGRQAVRMSTLKAMSATSRMVVLALILKAKVRFRTCHSL